MCSVHALSGWPRSCLSPSIAPSPLSLGMSAFWGTATWLPRERTQRRRAEGEVGLGGGGINKITLVFHLGEAGWLLLFSSMQI